MRPATVAVIGLVLVFNAVVQLAAAWWMARQPEPQGRVTSQGRPRR